MYDIVDKAKKIKRGENAGKLVRDGRNNWDNRFGMVRAPDCALLPIPFAVCHKPVKLMIWVVDIHIHLCMDWLDWSCPAGEIATLYTTTEERFTKLLKPTGTEPGIPYEMPDPRV